MSQTAIDAPPPRRKRARLRLVAGAILRRELLATFRARRSFWLLLGQIAFSSSIPLLVWGASGEFSTAATARNVVVFTWFMTTQACAAILIAPFTTAGSISSEREQETYELLYSTLLSPFAIVAAKAIAPIAFLLLMLAAAAPVTLVFYLPGGISFESVVGMYVITFAAVVTGSLCGLGASVRARKTSEAALRGVASVLFWNLGLYLIFCGILGALIELDWIDENASLALRGDGTSFLASFRVHDLFEIASNLSPPVVIATEPFAEMFSRGIPRREICLGYLALVSAWQMVRVLTSARGPELLTSARRERALLRKKDRRARRKPRAWSTRAFLSIGLAGVPLLRNPVFTKDLSSEAFGLRKNRLGAFGVTLVLALGSLALGEFHWFVLLPIGIVGMILIIVMTTTISSTSVTREVEQNQLDLLRQTYLGPGEIVLGKITASVFAGLGVSLALGIAALVTISFGTRGQWFSFSPNEWESPLWRGFVALLVAIISFAVVQAFVAALGVAISAGSRRSVSAILKTFGVLLALWIGGPFLMVILSVGSSSSFGEFFLTAAHPLFAFGRLGGELLQSSRVDTEAWIGWAISMSLYAVGTIVLFAIGVQRLGRRVSADE